MKHMSRSAPSRCSSSTTPATSDYDWIYNFRLAAEVEGVGTMFAAGECPWYAKDKVWGPDKRQISGNTTDLFCYIDCDGGGFNLDRVARNPCAPDVVRP